MALRNFFERLFGSPKQTVNPHEAELRRIMADGDALRRERKLDEALRIYQDGLVQAQQYGLSHIQEIFLSQIGALYTDRHEYEQAEQAFDEALTLANQSDAIFRRARALLNLGAYSLRRGDLEKARVHLEESLDLARKANDGPSMALALGNLVDVFLKQNNPSYAMRLLREVAPSVVNQTQQAAYLLGRMGQAHIALGEQEKGLPLLLQAARLAAQTQQPELELAWTSVLADQMYLEGRMQEATQLYHRADELAQHVNTPPQEYGALRSLINQARAFQRRSDNAEALDAINRALARARQEGNLEAEAQALTVLGSIQQDAGHLPDAVKALEEAVNLYNSRIRDNSERIKALVALGGLYADQHDNAKALDIFETALQSADENGTDPAARAYTLRRIGMMMVKQGQFQAALEKWTEALSLFELAGDHAQLARLLCDTGSLRRQLSGINAAMPDYERATMLLSNVRDSVTRGLVLSNVANVYTDLGEVETAKAFYEESLELARAQGNRRAEALRLGNYGWFHIMIGKPNDALTYLESALNISIEVNDKLFIAVQKNNVGQAHHELKNYERAAQFFGEALTAAQNLQDARWIGVFQSNLGRTRFAQGLANEALRLLEAALDASKKANDQETLSRTQARLAEVYLRQGRIDEADTLSRDGELMARKVGYRKGQAEALLTRANVAQARGDSEGQMALLREAKRIFTILHDPIAGDLARVLGD